MNSKKLEKQIIEFSKYLNENFPYIEQLKFNYENKIGGKHYFQIRMEFQILGEYYDAYYQSCLIEEDYLKFFKFDNISGKTIEQFIQNEYLRLNLNNNLNKKEEPIKRKINKV